MNECKSAAAITAIACKLFECMGKEEFAILSADLMQLADTITAMLVRNDICNKE